MKKAQQQHHQNSNRKSDADQIKDKVKESIEKGWCTFQADDNCGSCKSEEDSPNNNQTGKTDMGFNQNSVKNSNS